MKMEKIRVNYRKVENWELHVKMKKIRVKWRNYRQDMWTLSNSQPMHVLTIHQRPTTCGYWCPTAAGLHDCRRCPWLAHNICNQWCCIGIALVTAQSVTDLPTQTQRNWFESTYDLDNLAFHMVRDAAPTLQETSIWQRKLEESQWFKTHRSLAIKRVPSGPFARTK